VLYVLGDPAAPGSGPTVAVVGTRRPTDRGRRTAAEIAAALVDAGAAVVSGLAIGVDAVAHVAALERAGRTIAVLGSGHASLYPRVHRGLARSIAERGGAVLSELPPDTGPSRGTFPRRNRLISGLSDATIVVEAGPSSGALITAGWALEQGRECFVVPGALGEPASAGCLNLLRDGPGQVRVVAGIPELLEDLGLRRAVHDPGRSAGSADGEEGRPGLGQLELAIARSIADGARTADELVALTGMPVAAVLGALTLLEARGLAIGVFGRYQATPRLHASPPAA
jgi:DNA processing protein